MRSSNFVPRLVSVAAMATFSLAAYQEALASPHAGQSRPAGSHQVKASGRTQSSQPGSGGTTLKPASEVTNSQPGSGGTTLKPEITGGGSRPVQPSPPLPNKVHTAN